MLSLKGMGMKLYLISQNVNNSYYTYDSAVVAAKSPKDAQKMLPAPWAKDYDFGVWAAPEHVKVEYVGTAKVGTKSGTIICSSYNAG